MNYFEYFESFLNGSMSNKEMDAFNERLQNDTDFKNDFEFHKNAQDTFGVLIEDDIKNHIKTLAASPSDVHIKSHSEPKNEIDKKQKRLGIRSLLGIAASFLILVGCFFWFQQSNDNTELLFEKYYELPILETTRGENDPMEVDQKFFMKAHAKLFNKKYPEAIEMFTNLSQKPSNYKSASEWFLALTYLRDGKKEKAISLLDLIISSKEHPLYAKAIALRSEFKIQ